MQMVSREYALVINLIAAAEAHGKTCLPHATRPGAECGVSLWGLREAALMIAEAAPEGEREKLNDLIREKGWMW